ncbi:MAG: efflux RND transporter permease subunit [Opitutaceae bacterium]
MLLSQVSIRRPILTTMMSLGLLIFGILGLSRLPVRELPDVDPPIVDVLTVYPGASATVVETEVTERLEEAINSIEGIKRMTSQSREQVSNVTVEFNLGRDIDVAAQDVRDRVSRIRGRLPEDILEPVVAKQDSNAYAILWIALYSDQLNTLELSDLAINLIKDRLQTVEGVSSVIIGGEKRFAIRLWLDPEKMAARRVTVDDVQTALREQNIELPSGRVENLEREMTIQTRGEMKDPEEFGDLVIRRDGDTLIRLREIARVEAGVEDLRSVARYNSKPAVGIGIVRQSRSNLIDVARGIKAEMERLKPFLPSSVETFYAYDEAAYVEQAVVEVWETLGIAFVLVVLTIFIFLRSVRSTIVPVLAIPVSIVASFGLLYVLGYSINIITLLALILAIGIVVDDSIVVLENIFRHIEEGLSPMEAAKKSMEEIAYAIVTITLSLVAVFLPLAFLPSLTGRLFIEFATALSGSVLISAFVALTLAPMVASRALRPLNREKHGRLFNFFERRFDWINGHYMRVLRFSMRHRFLVIFGAIASLGLSALVLSRLDREFLPDEDKGRLFCILFAPEGSTSEYTDRMMRQMEAIVSETPEVAGYFTAVALPFSGPGSATVGFMFITLKEDRERHVREIVGAPDGFGNRFFTEIEGAFAVPNIPKAIETTGGRPFQLVLQSTEMDAVEAYTLELTNKLRQIGYLTNVRQNFEVSKPELRIMVERNRAAALGVSIEQVSRTLQILFGGQDLSRVKRGGKEYDVIAQLDRESRLTPSDLDRLYVRSATGQLVQLSNVARYETGAGPNAIYHFNRYRSATIEAQPVGITLGTAMERVEKLLEQDLPAGFRYEWTGESGDLQETGQDITFVFVLALVIVFMVLAAQFESVVHPFTVMLSLPLAFLGAFGLLWLVGWILPDVGGMNINLFSQIGLVLLVGLVTKNSILLVEFANQRVARGVPAMEAMIEAGRIRLRPILMTSLATIAGILPIAIGIGGSAEGRRPLGVAAVGGMVTSTMLTLIVIPVVYTLFADLTNRRKRKRTKAAGEAGEPVSQADSGSGD